MQTKFNTKVFAEGPNRLHLQLQTTTDCIVIPFALVDASKTDNLGPHFQHLDASLDGAISLAMNRRDFTGKLGETLLLNQQQSWVAEGIKTPRILLVGAGDIESSEGISDTKILQDFVKASRCAIKVLQTTQSQSCLWLLDSGFAAVFPKSKVDFIRQSILLFEEQYYHFGQRFTELKSQRTETSPSLNLKAVTFACSTKNEKQTKESIRVSQAIAVGVTLTKDLGNLPPNVCNPTYLSNIALNLGKDSTLKVQVLETKQLEKLGMGSFLAVARGSVTPPKFIIMQHQGGLIKEAPIVLVGKGITFDSGGISLKPGEGMDEMKYDMCGAASVLGTMLAVSQMKLKKNVIGVIPTCENMPSGIATRPGDIVTTMSGKTVEILNTDAEGRLILCDALTYVERFKPRAVIDIATLTGACVIALGSVHSGLFTKDEKISQDLVQVGKDTLDTVWPMPLDDAYQEQLKSNFADMANIGGRPAGSVTAACFLSRFTSAYPWAHLDIAGTAWRSGAAKGATGRPVPLLTEYLLRH
jgi:leucyl aminopeptidase